MVSTMSRPSPFGSRIELIFYLSYSAGLGTNGADGGSGGTIEVFVDEESTHLLFAVQFEVHGGKEGKPGCHGKPGKEGLGGNGGGGHTWYVRGCPLTCVALF